MKAALIDVGTIHLQSKAEGSGESLKLVDSLNFGSPLHQIGLDEKPYHD
jgi:hypothetical protein